MGNPFGSSQGESGAALVLVLLVAALLSAMVLAYVLAASRSEAIAAAHSSRLRAQLVLETAEAMVLADLRAELKAGSVSPSNQTSLYYPATAWSAVPWRSKTLPPNLIKQSIAGGEFYDKALRCDGAEAYPEAARHQVPLRAVAASTAANALNARGWDGARWNAPLLLPRQTPGSVEDFTPACSGYTRVDGAVSPWTWREPDWILMAQSGATPTAWSAKLRSESAERAGDSAVVARFAYQIYDQGGLLDLNVAGYDPALVPAAAASR
ncbi:MAG: hypothetical protein EBS01_09015, partial [Verrucomicrobia bacterium]|nr:hypothetical protein [Verrucomicrobiota bacterium]